MLAVAVALLVVLLSVDNAVAWRPREPVRCELVCPDVDSPDILNT